MKHRRQWKIALGAAVLGWIAVPRLCAQSLPMPVPTAAAPAPAAPRAQQPSVAQSDAPPTDVPLPPIPAMPHAAGTEVDRVVAVVNSDLILDSDLDQELRLAALLPYGEAGEHYDATDRGRTAARDAALDRLIERDLILQQLRLQPGDEISDSAVKADLSVLRSELPECSRHRCETQLGWDRFLASQGFTEAQVLELWKQRMEVLAFIEQRFRMGVRISQEAIQRYYDGPLRRQFAAQRGKEPPLDHMLSARIQQVLLEQQVNGLLDDWLTSLRAQGSVVVLHPGEAAP